MVQHRRVGGQAVEGQTGRLDEGCVLDRAEEADPVAGLAQRQGDAQEGKQVAGRADRDQDEVRRLGGRVHGRRPARSARAQGISRSARRRANRSKNDASVAW